MNNDKPKPWRYECNNVALTGEDSEISLCTILDANSNVIEEDEEYYKHVVECVNAYDKLIEENKQLEKAIQQIKYCLISVSVCLENYNNNFNEYWLYLIEKEINKAITISCNDKPSI